MAKSHNGGHRGRDRNLRKQPDPDKPKGSAARRRKSAQKWFEREREDYFRVFDSVSLGRVAPL